MTVHSGKEPKEFFVWVDPNDWLVQWNMDVGSFFGGTQLGGGSPEYLQFIANPKARPSAITPFHNNVIHLYRVEYNLETQRFGRPEFKDYPSRLWALFLLASKENALAYKMAHPEHVKGRVLKRCVTVGGYTYSVHDAAWIDFLRLKHGLDDDTLTRVAEAYWRGERTDQLGFKLSSMGKPWTPKPVTEILFYGTVNFPNKDPAVSDVPEPG